MSRRRHQRLNKDPLWFKDAVIYELHVRAFDDSNGDGIGDFNGLIKRLDYLDDLGITAIWLLPFYPSPLKDDGYDIADYMSVNPSYGPLSDFKRFLREAHARGIRVITELVINHTSTEHPWFQRAREAQPGSRYRDFYVWSDTPEQYKNARIIFQDFETSNWTWDPVAKAYYWHRFYSHQPDLNFENSEVERSLFKVVDFWMSMGVDGMRLDAVPYLFEREGTNCENLPETHTFLKRLRTYVDSKYDDRMLLAEANQWPEDATAYFGQGDECHMNFHFPLMPRMFMALHLEDRFPIVDILDQTPNIPDNCQWATFLRNHDELTLEMVTDEDRDYMWRVYAEDRQARINLGIRRRLAPLLRTRSKVELLNGLLFALPGTPVLYYGDEIGMGDNVYVGDRDGVRTPMQWSPDRNAGFSRANPQRLYLPVIVDPEYHFEAVNVETEWANPSSLLWWMKRLINLSRQHKAFGRGDLQILKPKNKKVLAFIRSYEETKVLVVANLSRYCQHVELDLSDCAGLEPEELFGRIQFPTIREQPYFLSLGPHAFFWFELMQPTQKVRTSLDIPSFGTLVRLTDLLDDTTRARLERKLAEFVVLQRWFRSKAKRIRSAHVVDHFEMTNALLLFVEIEFYEGPKEVYLLPLALAVGEDANLISSEFSHGILARVTLVGQSETLVDAIVCDATLTNPFAEHLMDMLADRKRIRGRDGHVVSQLQNNWKRIERQHRPAPKTGTAEQTNTSILYGEESILKLLRLVETGVNADVEIVRFLNERTAFKQVPELLAVLEYKTPKKEPATIGALQRYIPNRGDAWRFTLDSLDRYYDDMLAHAEDGGPELLSVPLTERAQLDPPEFISEALSSYVPLIRLLGSRTAELHAALGSDKRDLGFRPEAFTQLHQRSLYQSARTRFIATMDLLRATIHNLPDHVQKRGQHVLDHTMIVERDLRRIIARKIDALRIRCHGDYHLGQVLYTGKDFVIIDFEGEPARPISERRFKRSPLRDVAGMLRSFSYAAVTALRNRKSGNTELVKLKSWGRVWVHWVTAIFLKSYLDASADSPVVPQRDDDIEDLLQFYLLEKCVYELGYELNHRPDWVAIPLEGFETYLDDGSVPV